MLWQLADALVRNYFESGAVKYFLYPLFCTPKSVQLAISLSSFNQLVPRGFGFQKVFKQPSVYIKYSWYTCRSNQFLSPWKEKKTK